EGAAWSAGDVGRAAAAFAAQGHRDLELFRGLASAAAEALRETSWEPSARAEAEQAAWQVLESLDVLAIDDLEEARPLRRALEFQVPLGAEEGSRSEVAGHAA
ncbi:unnamed protein product, partial [Polarella glacialis]